jgi:hypothetical protein
MITNMTVVRWRADQPRKGRIYPKLTPKHPCYAAPCAICSHTLGEGPVQVLVVGPDDVIARARHAANRWYTANAVVVHQHCLAPLSDNEARAVTEDLEVREWTATAKH